MPWTAFDAHGQVHLDLQRSCEVEGLSFSKTVSSSGQFVNVGGSISGLYDAGSCGVARSH